MDQAGGTVDPGPAYQNLEFVIVMDNPQNNDAIRLIRAYEEQDRRIVFLINEQNMGLVKSLNRGLKHCSGMYIARMDADDISDSKRIEKQLAYLKNEKMDFIGCGSYRFTEMFRKR